MAAKWPNPARNLPLERNEQARNQLHRVLGSDQERDEGGETPVVARPFLSGFALVIVRGQPLGERVPVPPSGVVLGRSPISDVVIGTAGDGTSRRHAKVWPDDGSLRVEDLGSTNGLLVNRRRCKASGLKPGDLLQIGLTVMQVVCEGTETHRHSMVPASEVCDPLTGRLDWKNLEIRLHQRIPDLEQRRDPCCLAVVHLDRFGLFGDTHGTGWGQRLRHRVSRLICATLRATDFSCILGAESYLLVLPDIDLEGARDIAEEIRHAIAQLSFEVGGKAHLQTATIAYAEFDARTRTLRQASDALVVAIPWALAQGGNRLIDPEEKQEVPPAAPPAVKPPLVKNPPSDNVLNRLLKVSMEARSMLAGETSLRLDLPEKETREVFNIKALGLDLDEDDSLGDTCMRIPPTLL